MAKPGESRSSGGTAIDRDAKALYERSVATYRSGEFDSALRYCEATLTRQRTYGAAWNLKGVILNNLNRPRDAVACLEQGARLMPQSASPWVNMAKARLALAEPELCLQAAGRALKLEPGNLEAALFVARARDRMGEHEAALTVLDRILAMTPKSVDALTLKARVLTLLGRTDEGVGVLERAIDLAPEDDGLRLNRASLLLRLNRREEALAAAENMLAAKPDHAGALRFMADFHFYQKEDRHTANEFYRRSLAAQFDLRTAANLCFSLINTRGADEAKWIDEAQALAARCFDAYGFDPQNAKSFSSVFERTCDFAHLEKFDFGVCAEYWATNDIPGGLHSLLSHVKTRQDRLDLLAQHRRWGESIVKRASSTPVAMPPRRTRPKVRVGIMSSDLRDHPVTYFCLPIFEHYDRERIELYAYSFYPRDPDRVQQHLSTISTSFKVINGGNDRSVAEQMAGDDLDVLFELGGSTHLNRPSVLARRVAPVQASWLGYPHSIGLPTIDYLLVDPYLKPASDLMIEKPFEMPASWICLSRLGFTDAVQPAKEPPVVRNGFITYGTANNPMKYSQKLLALWARTMMATPGSRFVFVRPEGAVESFRRNVTAEFAKHGVEAERILFRPVRGAHLPFYGEMDISLDCAPQTGGTTTCESLWMGVPVVTLVGEAFFERISFSNNSNVGLGDLCAHSEEAFVATAAELAADVSRLRFLRKNLRSIIRRSPLGDTKRWVRDWEDRIVQIARR